MYRQLLLQHTSAGSAAAAGQAGKQAGKQADSRSHKSSSSSSSSKQHAAAAAAKAPSTASVGSAGNHACSSNAESGSSNRTAERQQACAVSAHVPSSFSKLASSLGISNRTAMWAAALLDRKAHVGSPRRAEAKYMLTSAGVTLSFLSQLTHNTRGEQAERILLQVAAWLQCLVQLPPSDLTWDKDAVANFLGSVEKLLTLQVQPNNIMTLVTAAANRAALQQARASTAEPQRVQVMLRELL
jgi:hypothetical protein